MKKILAITACMLAFVLVGQVKATPMYYTFTGIAGGIYDDAGIVAAQLGAGFAFGSAVSHTIIVDLAADGEYTRNNGTGWSFTDSATNNFFYSAYDSGTNNIWSVNGGYYNNSALATYNP